MATIIPMDAMTLTLGPQGNRSYLPEYIERLTASSSGRVFLVPENRPSKVDNDAHFENMFMAIAAHAPFTASDRVVIDRSAESGLLSGRLDVFQRCSEISGFPLGQIFYVSQNGKVALHPSHLGPKWVFFHHYAVSMSRKFRPHMSDFSYDSATPQVLCLNNKVRPQRMAVACEAMRLLGPRLNLTWLGKTHLYLPDDALDELRQELPSFSYVAQNMTLPDHQIPPSLGVGGVEDVPLEASAEAFLHLVTESDYRHYSDRFTEKVLKPIAMHRPFVVFGPKGILRKLRDFGFQTFSPVIDESYDDIEDADARLRAMFHSLVDITRADHKSVLAACRDICAHNQNHLHVGVEPYLLDRFADQLGAMPLAKVG